MSTKRFLHIIVRMNVDPGGFRCLRRKHCIRIVTSLSLLIKLLSDRIYCLQRGLALATYCERQQVVSLFREIGSEHELGVALQVTA